MLNVVWVYLTDNLQISTSAAVHRVKMMECVKIASTCTLVSVAPDSWAETAKQVRVFNSKFDVIKY